MALFVRWMFHAEYSVNHARTAENMQEHFEPVDILSKLLVFLRPGLINHLFYPSGGGSGS
jgi:hypothetical protein